MKDPIKFIQRWIQFQIHPLTGEKKEEKPTAKVLNERSATRIFLAKELLTRITSPTTMKRLATHCNSIFQILT